MAEQIKVWIDSEGDFIEIILRNAAGVYRDTEDDRVMKKFDSSGRVLAVSITSVLSSKTFVDLSIDLS